MSGDHPIRGTIDLTGDGGTQDHKATKNARHAMNHPIRPYTAGGLSLPILAALLNGAASMDLGSPRSRRPSNYSPAKQERRDDSRKALRKARRNNRRKA